MSAFNHAASQFGHVVAQAASTIGGPFLILLAFIQEAAQKDATLSPDQTPKLFGAVGIISVALGFWFRWLELKARRACELRRIADELTERLGEVNKIAAELRRAEGERAQAESDRMVAETRSLEQARKIHRMANETDDLVERNHSLVDRNEQLMADNVELRKRLDVISVEASAVTEVVSEEASFRQSSTVELIERITSNGEANSEQTAHSRDGKP